MEGRWVEGASLDPVQGPVLFEEGAENAVAVAVDLAWKVYAVARPPGDQVIVRAAFGHGEGPDLSCLRGVAIRSHSVYAIQRTGNSC